MGIVVFGLDITMFLSYLILGEYIIGSLSQLITFISFTGLLILSTRKAAGFKFSSAMQLYMVCCACLGFFSASHLIYLTLFWKNNGADLAYNAYYTWFSGVMQSIFLLSMPLCIFFLCINRVLTVLFPIRFTDRHRNRATLGMGIILIGLNAIVVYLDYIPDFPQVPITRCRAFGCMTPTTQALVYLNSRYTIAAANVVMAIVLVILVRKHLKGNSSTSQTNKTVLITTLFALLFDFIPHFSGLITFHVSNFL